MQPHFELIVSVTFLLHYVVCECMVFAPVHWTKGRGHTVIVEFTVDSSSKTIGFAQISTICEPWFVTISTVNCKILLTILMEK